MTLSQPVGDSAPLAYAEVENDKLEIQKSSYGVRDDLLILKDDNYPEIGACVLKIKDKDQVIIVPMAEDLSDKEYYSGYTKETISLSKVEKAIICASSDARAK